MDQNLTTLGFLLHEVARLLRKRFEQNARDCGLTRSQWQVLAYLAQNEGISQTGLAELLEIEPITLVRIVDRLEAQGLIQRCPHPTDRRVWRLRLTSAAHPKVAQLRELGEQTRAEALFGVSDMDKIQFVKTLQALKVNLTKAFEPPAAKQGRMKNG
ncbi:MarR family winged helix-turn-helix transcriptional regulator [Bradyrhizobium liaoningense]